MCQHEDWGPRNAAEIPRAATPSVLHPIPLERKPARGTYTCQRETRSAAGLVFHSLKRENAAYEYGVRCICALGWE